MGYYDNEVKRVCENCPRLLIMAVRMYEYAVKETVRTLPEDSDKYEIDVVMSHQAVIFLAGANKKTEIKVNLTLPDEQKVSYTVRCISASETV